MGNQALNQTESNDMQNYQIQKSQNIEGLGEIINCKDITTYQRLLILKTNYAIPFPQKAIERVESLKNMSEVKNAGRLLKYEIGKNQMLCYDNHQLFLALEDFDQGILDENNIKEPELWQIIDDLLNFLYELNHLGQSHGDLQPKYIRLTSNKVVKVLNPLMYTVYRNAYNFRLANDSYKSTYSPEQLDRYEFREQFNTQNGKSDVFSLGIIILSIVSKKDWENFYDFINNKIQMDKIFYEIDEISKRGFTQRLINFLKASLQEKEQLRASVRELIKIKQGKQQKQEFW